MEAATELIDFMRRTGVGQPLIAALACFCAAYLMLRWEWGSDAHAQHLRERITSTLYAFGFMFGVAACVTAFFGSHSEPEPARAVGEEHQGEQSKPVTTKNAGSEGGGNRTPQYRASQ